MSPKEIDNATSVAVEKIIKSYFPQKVILFGSSVKGRQHSDSDIDLLIIKDTKERFIDRWIKVRKIISDPGMRIPIDTLVLTPGEISERLIKGDLFIKEILPEGKILYAA